MTYITKGEYQTTDDGYLIGYKLITANYRSPNYHKFVYTQGKVAGHRSGEKLCTAPWCKGPFAHKDKNSEGDQIHHCCTQNELRSNWSQFINVENRGSRLVRLLIHPDDMIKCGVAYRAYVDMISPIMFQWGVFSPEGSLAPDLPPVTDLEKKKLNAGLSADEVISIVMTPAPESVQLKPTISSSSFENWPAANFPSSPYFTTRE